MSDWADIEAERSGLMDAGVPHEAPPATVELPRSTLLLLPSEIQRARFRVDAAKKRRKWEAR